MRSWEWNYVGPDLRELRNMVEALLAVGENLEYDDLKRRTEEIADHAMSVSTWSEALLAGEDCARERWITPEPLSTEEIAERAMSVSWAIANAYRRG